VGAIYTLRRASKIVWSFRHIKGHQDDHSTDLDVWVQCEDIAGWSWGLIRASGSYGKSIGSRNPLSQNKV
jgi:hypothetical protein